MKILFPIRQFLLLSLFLFSFSDSFSQEENPEKLYYRSSMLGIGKSQVYDTYLSPANYSGISLGFKQENMKMIGMMHGNIAAQQWFSIYFSSTENKAKTSNDYTGFLDYSYGLFYKFNILPGLKLFAGSQASGDIGVIYSSLGGNNPASVKANINLTLSGIASYDFKIGNQPFKARYQFSSPFIGIMVSPHYGQSYYEISLGDNDDLVRFASYHNQISMRNYLSLEIPLNTMTLRLMYANGVYQTKVNSLDTRIIDNSFFIGFSKEFISFSGKKKQPKKNYNRVFD